MTALSPLGVHPGGVQDRPAAGSGAYPQPWHRRSRGIQMTEPGCQRRDLDRKIRPVRSAAQVLEPPARGIVHPGHSTVCAEDDQPGAVRRVFQVAGLPQQARPQTLGEVRGEALHKPRLVPRERRLGLLAMQADVTPAGVPHPQHRAQLVLQPQRREDVPVTVTLRRVTAGRLHQRAHACRVAGQFGPLVDVLVQELVLDEIGAGFLRQFLAVGLGEQQGRRVRGRPPQRVDGHGLPQSRQDRGPEPVCVQPRPAGPDYSGGEIVERRTGEHGSLISGIESRLRATTS